MFKAHSLSSALFLFFSVGFPVSFIAVHTLCKVVSCAVCCIEARTNLSVKGEDTWGVKVGFSRLLSAHKQLV